MIKASIQILPLLAGGASELLEDVMPKKKQTNVRKTKRLKQAEETVVQAKPAANIRPLQRYGFLLPRRLSSNFNAAGQLVEVQALPNYVRETIAAKELADFRLVLGGLAQPGNRDAIFPVDIEQYLAVTTSEHERRALDIVEGKSPMGFNLAVLAARSAEDKPVFLYVLEDRLRHKMAVAGPEKIPEGLKRQLERGGVSYAVRLSSECDAVIDEFVTDGAKHRSERGFLLDNDLRSRQLVIDDLVHGVAALSDLREQGHGAKQGDGRTLGKVIRQALAVPACFTSIVCASQSEFIRA